MSLCLAAIINAHSSSWRDTATDFGHKVSPCQQIAHNLQECALWYLGNIKLDKGSKQVQTPKHSMFKKLHHNYSIELFEGNKSAPSSSLPLQGPWGRWFNPADGQMLRCICHPATAPTPKNELITLTVQEWSLPIIVWVHNASFIKMLVQGLWPFMVSAVCCQCWGRVNLNSLCQMIVDWKWLKSWMLQFNQFQVHTVTLTKCNLAEDHVLFTKGSAWKNVILQEGVPKTMWKGVDACLATCLVSGSRVSSLPSTCNQTARTGIKTWGFYAL